MPNSPLAKGRVERDHGTHQDRLLKKLPLAGMAEYEAVNRYLEQPRVVSNDWAVSYRGRLLQLQRQSRLHAPVKSRVPARENEAGELAITYRGQRLRFRDLVRRPEPVREARADVSLGDTSHLHRMILGDGLTSNFHRKRVQQLGRKTGNISIVRKAGTFLLCYHKPTKPLLQLPTESGILAGQIHRRSTSSASKCHSSRQNTVALAAARERNPAMEFDPSIFCAPRWGWLTIWVICVFVLVFFATMLHVAGATPWSDTSDARVDGYHHEQCESVDRSGFFLQFHNFWSNSAYFAAGLLIVWLSDIYVGNAIGWTFIFLAFGSAWFHGTLTETGQTFDMVGVYCALTVLIPYALIELIPLDQDRGWSWTVFIIALVVGIIAGPLRPGGILTLSHFKIFGSDVFTPLLVAVLMVYMFLVIWRREFRFWNPILGPILGFAITGLLALVFKSRPRLCPS